MELLASPASPFARKTRIVLREGALNGQVAEVMVSNTPYEPEPRVLAANPLGKIPALIRDDGPALYDSRVICRFLDDAGGSGLYPQGRIWDILTLEATADGIMEACLSMTYEGRYRDAAAQSGPWVEAQWAKAARALDVIENRWMSLLSGPLNMGQVAVGCALGYIDLRHGSRGWRDGRDTLAGWYAAFALRDSFAATRPD